MVPIVKEKDDIRNCIYQEAMKLLEHGMKMVDRVLEKSLHRISIKCNLAVCWQIHAVLILRRQQEECWG